MQNTELLLAIEKGDTATVSKMLEAECEVLLKNTNKIDACLTEEIKNNIQKIQLLINQGVPYQHLTPMLAKSIASVFLIQEYEQNKTNSTPIYNEFIIYLKEARARLFLAHRFGLNQKTTLNGETFSPHDLQYANAIIEVKSAFKRFMGSEDHYKKIFNLLTHSIKPILKAISAPELHLKAEKEAFKLMQLLNEQIAEMCTPEYFNSFEQKLKNKEILIIPILTLYPSSAPHQITTHAEALALGCDKLFKLNRAGLTKTPNITLYKIQKYSLEDMTVLIKELLNSFATPQHHTLWEKSINELTKPEKIKTILTKEQFVGNRCWATAKLFIYTLTFVTLLKFFRSQGLKDIEPRRLVIPITDIIYKQFTTADRNYAVSDYLALHGIITTEEPSTVSDRVQNIKQFLKKDIAGLYPADKEILTRIYIKSINKLLADHLKKGDIGTAQELVRTESLYLENWNPLFYAAMSEKLAIAELLANNHIYVNGVDQNHHTPLHLATIHGHLSICKILINHQKKNHLNLKAVNFEGNTALHLAVLHNREEIANFLLKHDPELLNMKNSNGETAFKLAEDNGDPNMIKLLSSKGELL